MKKSARKSLFDINHASHLNENLCAVSRKKRKDLSVSCEYVFTKHSSWFVIFYLKKKILILFFLL